ncbi:hypothetical protein [Parablautia muri]|nr:hypothetical protein [Parablautia muri]
MREIKGFMSIFAGVNPFYFTGGRKSLDKKWFLGNKIEMIP